MSKKEILVLEELLGSNKKIAAEIRKKLEEKGILTINLLSSPGAGKTTLLEKTAEKLKANYRMAVIEGDIETERDAERIRAKGIQSCSSRMSATSSARPATTWEKTSGACSSPLRKETTSPKNIPKLSPHPTA